MEWLYLNVALVILDHVQTVVENNNAHILKATNYFSRSVFYT